MSETLATNSDVVVERKAWSSKEVAFAARLWDEGKTIPEIAAALERNQPGVRHMIRRNRSMFPRRSIPWGTAGSNQIKISITPFVQQSLDFHAARAKVSTSRFLQLLILDATTNSSTMARVEETAKRRSIV